MAMAVRKILTIIFYILYLVTNLGINYGPRLPVPLNPLNPYVNIPGVMNMNSSQQNNMIPKNINNLGLTNSSMNSISNNNLIQKPNINVGSVTEHRKVFVSKFPSSISDDFIIKLLEVI